MPSERKLIRDAVKAALESEFSFSIFSTRDVDGCELNEFINVFLLEGGVEYQGLQSSTQSEIFISYRTEDLLDDDQLDEVGDRIEEIISVSNFGDVLQGIIYAGFEYLNERERGFTGLTLRYSIVY